MEFDDPESRAMELLRSMLTAAQRVDLNQHGRFEVTGSEGGRYRVRKGRHGNVDKLDDEGEITDRYCAVPAGDVPTGDAMLVQVLMLRIDERAFREIANRSDPPHVQMARAIALVPTYEDAPEDTPYFQQEVTDESIQRVRLVSTALRTPAGRERLAQAILGRIRYGGPALPEVAIEVTQLAHAVIARSGEDQTEGVRGLIDWLQEAA